MKPHGHLPKRNWVLIIVVILLLAAHGIVPYLLSRLGHLSHTSLSFVVVSGVAVLVVIKHLGLIGSLFALLRRRSQ